jgi:hypothetical protein
MRSLAVEVFKTCKKKFSKKNQSKVKNLMYKKIIDKNKFKEAKSDVQK